MTSSDPDQEWEERRERWVGRILDHRYAIDEVLAEGGMGTVFAATHLRLEKPVAVKIIQPEYAGDEEVVQRFAREVEANSRLEHPNIVSALDCGTSSEGEPYLVMQYVRGRTVAEALEAGGPFEWRTVAAIGADLADALAVAHRAGIVHRDLKPDNILLVPTESDAPLPRERAMLLDFGIARFVSSDSESQRQELTRKGTAVGTVGYMAPEQSLGQEVDGRADLYALGVVLFEMLTARPLFDPPLTLETFAARQLQEKLPSLRSIVTTVPQPMVEVVEGLVVFEKQRRSSDAAEVRARLRAIALGDEPRPAPRAPDLRSQLALGARQVRDALGHLAGRSRQIARGVLQRWFALPPPQVAAVGVAVGVVGSLLVFGVSGSLLAVFAETSPEMREAAEGEVEAPPSSPPVLEEAFATLLGAPARSERRAAAREVLRHEPRDEVDEVMLDLARLEVVQDCRARERAVRALGAAGDERALEPLGRYRRDPCGRRFRQSLQRATQQIRRRQEG